MTINGGMVMPAWYDILNMDFDQRRVDEDGVRASAARLEDLVARERDRGIPAARTVLAGFSQGGAIALHAGLRHPERLAGVLALSTYLAVDGDAEDERAASNLDVPILQCHGSQDPMVPMTKGEAARDRLRELGYEVEWEDYPMQHQVCMEEIERIGAWLRRGPVALTRERPAPRAPACLRGTRLEVGSAVLRPRGVRALPSHDRGFIFTDHDGRRRPQ